MGLIMKNGVTLLVLTFHIILNSSCGQFLTLKQFLPEDGKLNFTQLANKYGKKVEEFEVVTEDGYIITLFHFITAKKVDNPPIYLQHGIADCADTFIIRGKSSLSMTLVSAGYDVWVGNTRGNKYSRRHVKLDPDGDAAFWDFSVHENGYYDVAANIDLVLAKSGRKSLIAIAHSQGTTDFFVLGSTRPEYNSKIDLMIAMAPVAFLNNVRPPVSDLVQSAPIINMFLKSTGQNEILSEHSLNKAVLKFICSQQMMNYDICAHGLLFALGGSDPSEFEKEFLPVVVGYYPQGTSRKQLLHLSQIARRKSFAQFDYDTSENFARYNSTTPPAYNLSSLVMRTALLVSRNDPISTLKDTKLLKKQLPNVVEYFIIEPPKWNHLDWVWGLNMSKYLHPHIIRLIEKFK